MKPVTVSVIVDRPLDEVYAYLDVLENHQRFTDHFLLDWTLSGPPAGVGARARMRAKAGGSSDWIELEVIDAEAPRKIVERSVGARGRRLTRGTYTLSEAGPGRTLVQFELAYERAPASERLAGPLVRSLMRRANERAMTRLGEALAA